MPQRMLPRCNAMENDHVISVDSGSRGPELNLGLLNSGTMHAKSVRANHQSESILEESDLAIPPAWTAIRAFCVFCYGSTS